jgi:hypothetical protein
VLIAAAVPVNVTEANPACAVTEDGTVRLALLLLRVITDPPAGATALRVAVQVELPGVTTDVGLHVNELRTMTAGAVRERRAVCDELPRVAVTVAD